MSFFPSGAYYRMVHANDPVPHLPMTELNFNHAGDEVWYYESGTELDHKICLNQPGVPENPSCADTLWSYDPDAHMIYVGIDFRAGWCGPSSANSSSFLA